MTILTTVLQADDRCKTGHHHDDYSCHQRRKMRKPARIAISYSDPGILFGTATAEPRNCADKKATKGSFSRSVLRLIIMVFCWSFLARSALAKSFNIPLSPPDVAPLIGRTYPNDLNRTRIDDGLEARAEMTVALTLSAATARQVREAQLLSDAVVNVELIFNEQITHRQIDEFKALGGEITYVYKAVSYGWNGRIPLGKVNELPAGMGTTLVLVEEPKPAQFHIDVATRTGRVRPIWAPGFAGNPSGFDGGSPITIAIIDSGIDSSHTDILGREVYWHDFSSDNLVSPVDIVQHGSHVAGIALGTGAAGGSQTGTLYYTDTGELSTVPGGSFQVSPIDLPVDSVTYSSTAYWTGGGSTDLYQAYHSKGAYGGWTTMYSGTFGPSPLTKINSFTGLTSRAYSAALFSNGGIIEDYVITNSVTNYPGVGDGFNKFSGVAPACQWAAAKVSTNSGSIYMSWVGAAIDDLVANRVAYNIKVMNLSLGASGDPGLETTVRQKINSAVNNGIIVVASAGNDGDKSTTDQREIDDPGRAAMALTVAAANDNNELTYYTSHGFSSPESTAGQEEDYKPDITAPGGSTGYWTGILSVDSNSGDGQAFADQCNNDYLNIQGTSMASPFAAGCAALVIDAMQQQGVIWDFYSSEHSSYAKMILCATASETNAGREDGNYNPTLQRDNNGPIGFPVGKDPYEGYGMINADAAVEAVSWTYTLGETVNETLGSQATDRRVWAQTVSLTAGSALDPSLSVPVGADFDLYVYSTTPSSYGTPIILASGTNVGSGIDESIYYLPDEDTDVLLVVKCISGSGTFSLTSTGEPESCCPVTISSFPYNEDFEAEINCSTDCGDACLLSGDWANDTYDQIDWTVNSGETPSILTGPSQDHNPGTADGKYLYIESSSGCYEATAILLSPCFDLGSLSNPGLTFWYHMYGSNMGTLTVEVSEELLGVQCGGWNSVWTQSGNQANQWLTAMVDLSSYSGVVKIRFVGETGISYASDMAIDDISVGEYIPPPESPSDMSHTATGLDSITWSWTDNSDGEDGFCAYDEYEFEQWSVGADVTEYQETGLNANTEYTREVAAYSSHGQSDPSNRHSAWTLPADPLVSSDRNIGNPGYPTNTVFTFTNDAGFDSGGVDYYLYAWDQNESYSFVGSEPVWNAGTLQVVGSDAGEWYLHLLSRNGNHDDGGTADWGRYCVLDAPVLSDEPDMTKGSSNTILWNPVPGADDYYAQCAEEADFNSITAGSGWIADPNYKFPDLTTEQTYWYRVKARRAGDCESDWSNAESSTQYITIGDFDQDDDVDLKDFSVLALSWLEAECDQSDWCSGADLNKSTIVDLTDLCEFAEHWLETRHDFAVVDCYIVDPDDVLIPLETVYEGDDVLICFKFDYTGPGTTATTRIQLDDETPLETSETYTDGTRIFSYLWTATLGEHRIRGWCDFGEDVLETDEANNDQDKNPGFTVVPYIAPGMCFDVPSSWTTFDPGANGVDSNLDGYNGGAFDGRYIYFAPYDNNVEYHGKVLRYDTNESFLAASSWAAYDPGANGVGNDPDGYMGAAFDGRYVYFAPYYNGSKHHGEVLRYDTTGDFNNVSSWAAYDPGDNGVGSDPDGYMDLIIKDRYIYFVPYYDGSYYHNEVLRYDTAGNFSQASSWATYEPNVGTNPIGYSSAASDGRYIYFTPFYNVSYHGEVLRYDTVGDFDNVSSWDAYDPGANGVGDDPDGYHGAVFDGKYLYFAPYDNGSGKHGEVLRYDTTANFDEVSSWTTYDPGDNGVGNDPDGYVRAVLDGQYIYFVPYNNGTAEHGEVLRYDITGDFDDVSSWATYDPGANGVGNDPDGYRGAVLDGQYIYFVPFNNGSEKHGEVLRYNLGASCTPH